MAKKVQFTTNQPSATTDYLAADNTWKTIPGGGGGSGIPKGTTSGTDTYTTTITGITAYNDGDAYLIRFATGNTTQCTLNINSLGAKDLYRNNNGLLIGGDIVDGAEMFCIYNSTLNGFQVIGTAPNTLLAYVTNDESTTITKGQAVYAFGGTGDRLTVKLANNSSDATSAQTVGIVLSSSIAANQKGLIIVNGQLDGLSLFPTSTWADGDAVYLGATAGTVTNVKPYAPNHLVYLGFVTTANNGSAGRMYVRVQNGYEMQELHNVSAQTPANNDILKYNTTTSLWETSNALSTKQDTITGAASTITTSNLTPSTALVSNGGGKVASSAVTTTELGRLVGVTSDIQTQLNAKQGTLTLTTTGTSGAATLVGSTLNVPNYTNGMVNVYTKNSTTYSSVGTANQILTSLLIPANTFTTGDVLRISARFKKSAANNSSQASILINTSVSTTGAITWKGNTFTTTQLAIGAQGTGVIINNTSNTQLPWPATNQGATDLINTTQAWQESAAINWTVNQYLLFFCNPNSALDTVSLIFYMIEKL